MSAAPTIRLGEARDAAVLAELGARTFSDTFLADNRPEDIAAFVAATYGTPRQLAELADPGNVFLLAESGETAVGYVKLQWSEAPRCVEGEAPIQIDRFYVAREQLGLGVGVALMERAIAEARARGARTMWLGVWENNARARRFYVRWGFHVVGEHGFQLGSDLQNDLLMTRAL